MKRIIIAVVCLCLLLTSCEKNGASEETTTTAVQISSTTEPKTTEALTETTVTTTEATTQNNIKQKNGKLILDNGKYRYEIEKTDFEKEYPEELLLQFVDMLSMDFGVEDYYDWNTTGQNVFLDVHHCCISVNNFMKMKNLFDFDNSQEICQKFIKDAQLEELWGVGIFTFSLREYNDYLTDMFGPNAVQLKTSDFETAKSAKEKGLPLSGSLSEGDVRCFYSEIDDIILVQCCPTGYAGIGEYVYDIQKKDGDYYVRTIGSFETYESADNFKDFQQTLLEDLNHGIKKYMQTKVYKFGCTDDGDAYLKSVDKNYLIADNAEYDYIVVSDKPVEMKVKTAYTEEYSTAGTISNGTKVLSTYNWDPAGLRGIVTEDGAVYIETKYLKEIDG